MNINRHFHSLTMLLRDAAANATMSSHDQDQGFPDRDQDYTNYGSKSTSILQGLSANSQEILDAAEEVAAEQQARLALVSRDRDLCRRVLTYLRQQPLRAAPKPIAREGTWLLVTLPDPEVGESFSQSTRDDGRFVVIDQNGIPSGAGRNGENGNGWSFTTDGLDAGWPDSEAMLANLTDADVDLILYLINDAAGWHDEDAQWFARVRAQGVPVLPLLIMDAPSASSRAPGREEVGQEDEQLARLRTQLGIRPCLLTIADLDQQPDAIAQPPDDVIELINRILALRPRLGIPLAQDIPWCRRTIAQRTIRTGALVSALVGAEPIPLLDLPIHVALHWKVALQLAAIHGRPGLDFRSREMVGTIFINLVMRTCAQQLLKIIPFVGWLLSGVLSGVSTMLLGHALLRYYENDEIWSWTATKQAWRRQGRQTSGRMGRKFGGFGRRVRRTGGAAAATWRTKDDADAQTIPIEGQQ